MNYSISFLRVLIFVTFVIIFSGCQPDEPLKPARKIDFKFNKLKPRGGYTIINQTFLGNFQRNYYGNYAPDSLRLIWKTELGTGKTRVGSATLTWSGAGWTGQPLIVSDSKKTFILQGTYEHNIKKIDAATGKVLARFDCGDVIKGTGTLYYNGERLMMMQGSRTGGTSQPDGSAASFRAIDFQTFRMLWSIVSVKTKCYSRDVDGSAIVVNDTGYIGLENGLFTVFDPNKTKEKSGLKLAEIYEQHWMYEDTDIAKHGGNLVTESSPSILGNRVYVASGSGHVYGYNLKTRKIDWDFFIGADMDGSPVVTDDGCILISVEKEYIPGSGGIYKLDPSKPADSTCVKWFMPTGDRFFVFWYGGVIGSVGINDKYRKPNDRIPNLAVFTAIDGNMYVVKHKSVTTKKSKCPQNKYDYPQPEVVFKYPTGVSISTPIIVGNKIVAAGYDGLYLFKFDENLKFELIKHIQLASIEATPVVHNGRIYIAARDGYLYCFGN